VADALLGRRRQPRRAAPHRLRGEDPHRPTNFGVSWQDHIAGGGVVASTKIDLILDVEAIHEGDLRETGAIRYYE